MSFYPAFWEPACHAGIPSLVNKTARIHKEHKSQTNRKLVSVLNPTCVRPSKQANMHNSFIILYTLKKTCWSHSFAEPSHAGSKLWRIKLPRSTWPPNKHTLLCWGLCCVQRSSSHTVPRATRPATVCRWGSYQSSGRRDATRAPVSPPPFTSRTGTGSAHGRLVAVCLFRQAHTPRHRWE
jgi:hypothetical protein